MNKQIFQGQWNQVKGKIQGEWGKLTDDELDEIKGNNQEIFGFLQKHYGYAKDEAKEKVNDFLRAVAKKADDSLDYEGLASFSTELKKLSSIGGKVMSEKVQANPLATVGIALTAGVIVGWLCGRK